MSRRKILLIEVGVVFLVTLGPSVGWRIAHLGTQFPDSTAGRLLAYFDARSIGSATYGFAAAAFVLYTLWASGDVRLDFGIRLRPGDWISAAFACAAGVVVVVIATLSSPPPSAAFEIAALANELTVGGFVVASLYLLAQSLLFVTAIVGYGTTRLSELLPGRVLPLLVVGICGALNVGISTRGVLIGMVLTIVFALTYQKIGRLGWLLAIVLLVGACGLATELAHVGLTSA